MPYISEQEKAVLADAYFAGIEKAAAEAGLEKEAILGLLGKGLMSLGRLGLKGMGKLTDLTAKPFAAAGRGIEGGLQRALPKAKWLQSGAGGEASALRNVFKGTARDMASFGLLGGGIGALTSEPGQRGEGFLKGFLPGALGGLGWGAGSNLASAGLNRLGVGQLAKQTIQPGMSLGQKAKIVGSKAVMPVATMGAGMAGSMAIDPTMYGSGQTAMQAAPAARPMSRPMSFGYQPQGYGRGYY